PGKTFIEDIRFIDNDASDCEVEFEFNAVAPVHIKGRVDDPEIQRLLTHALLNESNAGVRLSSMQLIRDQAAVNRSVDPAVKQALITSLKTDANPGVRNEALRVLQQYGFDDDLRDALLHVIEHDENSGIRVAAINALELAKMDGNRLDEATVKALKEQIAKEENNYIRNRAVNLVKEIYQ
ncbi:MAG: HEAT repeat domain-containing protein, partial [Bacteroidetes bacterium]|nr:HEAT repeat domain-containing protein [Bacteroidota bacterium]